jgi:hypothetical protein
MADEATPPGGGYSADKLDQLLSLLRKRELDAQGAAEAAVKGAAGGGAMAGLPGALIGAGLSVATPFVTKALGGLFGVSDAEEEERRALERAKAPFKAVAEGGTTQGQAGLAYARGRALQDLQAQTNRGTAQQQAGLQRAAMQQGADVQAQYAAQLSELRSREQERARAALGYMEQLSAERAAKEAQRGRQALSQGIAGAIVPLAQQLLTPSAKTGLTPEEIADYNAKNTKGTAANAGYSVGGTTGDLGAAFAKRAAELADPYAGMESATLTGNELTGGGMAGGGVAGGQFGFDLAGERAPNAANIASAGRRRSPNIAAVQTPMSDQSMSQPDVAPQIRSLAPTMVAGGAAGGMLDQELPQADIAPQIRTLAPQMVNGGAAGGFEEPDAASLQFSELQRQRRGKGGFVSNALSGIRRMKRVPNGGGLGL